MRWPTTCSVPLLILLATHAPATAADMRAMRSTTVPPVAVGAGPALLGTVAVPIRAQRFNDSMRRALEDASASPAMQQLVAPARRLPRLQQVAYVQRAVSVNIRWASDATQWGHHDYWASAAQTLASGSGDMEDRAILKLQALRALGFNSNDLFLTLARDRVGGPQTVVAARVDGRFYILDDTGGTPFPVEQRRYEFQPQISFGYGGAWVHTRAAPSPPAARAATALAPK